MNTVQGVLVLVLVVLPGFVASVFARGHDIEPQRRSATDSIAFLLHFAVYVHFLVASVFSILDLRYPLQLLEIFEKGPREYLLEEPLRGILVYAGYLACIMLVAPLVGVYNLPRVVPGLMVAVLRRAKVAPVVTLSQEPIWYAAFQQRKEEAGKDGVWLRVKLNNGDIYKGTLVKFPILADDVKSKDFLIDNVTYAPQGDSERQRRLSDVRGFGGVLLNTRDVNSIEFAYYDADPN